MTKKEDMTFIDPEDVSYSKKVDFEFVLMNQIERTNFFGSLGDNRFLTGIEILEVLLSFIDCPEVQEDIKLLNEEINIKSKKPSYRDNPYRKESLEWEYGMKKYRQLMMIMRKVLPDRIIS